MATDTAELLRKALDVLAQTPGSLVYRGPDRWRGLLPGPIGWVLIIGEDGLPKWENPANVSFGS